MSRARAQVPYRLTPERQANAVYHIDEIDANLSFQAWHKHQAAKRWEKGLSDGEYVWLGVSGAATPAGFGGIIADLIAAGAVHGIVTTGANAYHDLHFAFGLPVRHGAAEVDDDNLREDGTTRIYNVNVHNTWTLKAQDYLNQQIARRIHPRLRPPYSTATLLNEFGKELLDDDSGKVVDKEGSFLIRAAEFDVPVYLDSADNHSFGMDLSPLALEGLRFAPDPNQDVVEMAAYSLHFQPQLNIFFGEGGPRNKIQTTGPTASEIFAVPFNGSAGCILFTIADPRAGALSGSTQSEAVTWGKYLDADPQRESVIWSEYTTTVPDVAGYVAATSHRKPPGLFTERAATLNQFLEEIETHKSDRITMQEEIARQLPDVVAAEKDARKQAGYRFNE